MAFQKGHKSWLKGKHIQINNALEIWRKNGGQPWNKNKHTGIKPWLGKKRPNMIGNKYSFGIIRSKEFKNKISKAMKGRKLSEKTKEKIGLANSISQKGRIGVKSSAWKGGRIFQLGYIKLYLPKHPYADSKGYYQEHRYIMEQHIGRFLKPEEAIHHINRVKDDNRFKNLMLFKNKSEHRKYHFKYPHNLN